jgi:hypothetical protein
VPVLPTPPSLKAAAAAAAPEQGEEEGVSGRSAGAAAATAAAAAERVMLCEGRVVVGAAVATAGWRVALAGEAAGGSRWAAPAIVYLGLAKLQGSAAGACACRAGGGGTELVRCVDG